jgi:hypothetical protein
MPIMKEMLRLRQTGGLDEIQRQWFRPEKVAEELFDTYADPHELNNLAALPEYKDKLAELRNECDHWMKSIDDKGLIPEPEYVRSIWKGDQQPTTANPDISIKDHKVSITCLTPGASIGYQLSGGTTSPKAWNIYTQPFDLPGGSRILAIAHRIGYLTSNVIEK